MPLVVVVVVGGGGGAPPPSPPLPSPALPSPPPLRYTMVTVIGCALGAICLCSCLWWFLDATKKETQVYMNDPNEGQQHYEMAPPPMAPPPPQNLGLFGTMEVEPKRELSSRGPGHAEA